MWVRPQVATSSQLTAHLPFYSRKRGDVMTTDNFNETNKRLLLAASAVIGISPANLLSDMASVSERHVESSGWAASLDDTVVEYWPSLTLQAQLVAVLHAAALDRYQHLDV